MSSTKDISVDTMETNLDEVEVDQDGNLRVANTAASDSSETGDEIEINVDGIDVDEDGNLRIHSSSSLLNYISSNQDSHENLSASERQALQRMQSDKQRYSEEGTPEEGMEMDYLKNQRLSHGRRRSFTRDEPGPDSYHSLAIGSNDVDSHHGPSYAGEAEMQGHDFHDIELTVFDPCPAADSGVGAEVTRPSASVHSIERGERAEQDSKPDSSRLQHLWDIMYNFFRNLSPQRLAILIAVVVVIVGVILTLGLVPASFIYVEYYELALAKNRVSGKVNREDVYYPGCYLLTPDIELIRFRGTAHTFSRGLDILTSDKLSFNLELTLQYFIKPEELGLLFTNFEHNYESVIETVVISTMKNEAVKYNLDNFRLNRSMVEQNFKQALAYRLSGDCCPSCCPRRCGASVDCRSCRLAGRCYQGFHMEMRYFQMGAINIPEEVSERFLRQTILLVEAEKEVFLQQHAVEVKLSEQLQKDILNRAGEIRDAATAEADKILAVAQSEHEKEVQASYFQAMKRLYQQLNFTQEDHKLSLMYIHALEGISDKLYNLNFDKLTAYGQG